MKKLTLNWKKTHFHPCHPSSDALFWKKTERPFPMETEVSVFFVQQLNYFFFLVKWKKSKNYMNFKQQKGRSENYNEEIMVFQAHFFILFFVILCGNEEEVEALLVYSSMRRVATGTHRQLSVFFQYLQSGQWDWKQIRSEYVLTPYSTI